MGKSGNVGTVVDRRGIVYDRIMRFDMNEPKPNNRIATRRNEMNNSQTVPCDGCDQQPAMPNRQFCIDCDHEPETMLNDLLDHQLAHLANMIQTGAYRSDDGRDYLTAALDLATELNNLLDSPAELHNWLANKANPNDELCFEYYATDGISPELNAIFTHYSNFI